MNTKTKEITATSSLTINLGNYNSARIEFSVTKEIIEEGTEEEMKKVKEELWDEVNKEVDNQIAELKTVFNK